MEIGDVLDKEVNRNNSLMPSGKLIIIRKDGAHFLVKNIETDDVDWVTKLEL